jgi:hypothetical protein
MNLFLAHLMHPVNFFEVRREFSIFILSAQLHFGSCLSNVTLNVTFALNPLSKTWEISAGNINLGKFCMLSSIDFKFLTI